MIVCPDCRTAQAEPQQACKCGWSPQFEDGIAEYLNSQDRASAETADYINTYSIQAEKNLSNPSLSDTYVSNLARRFADAIGDVSGKDFCDVGAGRGHLIEHVLKRSPKSVLAVDIAAPSVKDVSKKLGVPGMIANAEHLPFDRHFDVIAATDIVEHVLNVANFLVTANWSLKDNGILAVRVPFLEEMVTYSNFFGLPMHYTHLRTFDRRTLVSLVEPFGFKINRVVYDGFFTDRQRPVIKRIPLLRHIVRKAIKLTFRDKSDVTNINPVIGRLLMKPVEIGVIAQKVRHIEAVNVHEELQQWFNRAPEEQDPQSISA